MSYQVGNFLRGGKASELYEVLDDSGKLIENRLIIRRKNEITAGDGEMRDVIAGKGAITNIFSNLLFQLLEKHGIPTHFEQQLNDYDTVIKKLEMFPLEVIGRNVAAGSLLKRLPFQNGQVLDPMLLELCLKDDARHDPLLNDEHVMALHLMEDPQKLEDLKARTRAANSVLKDFFAGVGITFVDFKLELGCDESGLVVIGDEISPDTCRFWDMQTGESLDKDVFRTGRGSEATLRVYNRMMERLHAAVS